MNSFSSVTDAEYVYVELANGSQGKILKNELVHIGCKGGFNGNFKDPVNFPRSGYYLYSVNTSNTGIINGPDGIDVLYGVVEIISRLAGEDTGLNVVTIRVYDRYRKCYMLIGSKATGDGNLIWGAWKDVY